MVAITDRAETIPSTPAPRARGQRGRSGWSQNFCGNPSCKRPFERPSPSQQSRLGSCSRDPIGYRGSRWSLYEYVGGNPIIRVDPSGEDWPKDWYPMGPGALPPPVPSHPDNLTPIDEFLHDPAVGCAAMNEGCYRHCVSSCKLWHRLPPFTKWLTQPCAQYAGGDLPWQSTRDPEDVDCNSRGIRVAKKYGRGVSCKSKCKDEFFEKLDSICGNLAGINSRR